MIIHKVFLIYKKLVTILKVGEEDFYAFGIFPSPCISSYLKQNFLTSDTFYIWFCSMGRAEITLGQCSQGEALGFEWHNRALCDGYSVSHEIFPLNPFTNPFTDTSSS